MTLFIWARWRVAVFGLLALPRNQANRYGSLEAALAAKGSGDDGFPGERLFCITVEEIEV